MKYLSMRINKKAFQGMVLLLIYGASSFGTAAPIQEKPVEKEKKTLTVFMRKKLAASSMILEGLAVEDFTLISEGSRKLQEMSKTEQWRVHNDPMYRQFSGEFQRITEKLSAAAKEGKLDAAALSWVDATMSCIECHQYVRKMMITEK